MHFAERRSRLLGFGRDYQHINRRNAQNGHFGYIFSNLYGKSDGEYCLVFRKGCLKWKFSQSTQLDQARQTQGKPWGETKMCSGKHHELFVTQRILLLRDLQPPYCYAFLALYCIHLNVRVSINFSLLV